MARSLAERDSELHAVRAERDRQEDVGRSALGAAEGNVTYLRNKALELEAELDRAEVEVVERDRLVRDLETQLREKTARLQLVERELAHLQMGVHELDHALQGELDSRDRDNQTLRDGMRELEAELGRVEGQLSQVSGRLASEQSRGTELRRTLESALRLLGT